MTRAADPGPSDRTLTFCRALLALTVRENGDAMAAISRVFEEAAGFVRDLEAPSDNPASRVAELGESRARLGEALRRGLAAVQLHDITDQRLAHVKLLLDALSRGREIEIAPVLSDAEERVLLELVDNGLSAEEACVRLAAADTARGSVELF
ncbi:MAG: hypothetical protein RIC56_21720 [Pseudomonadales bacterium]